MNYRSSFRPGHRPVLNAVVPGAILFCTAKDNQAGSLHLRPMRYSPLVWDHRSVPGSRSFREGRTAESAIEPSEPSHPIREVGDGIGGRSWDRYSGGEEIQLKVTGSGFDVA